MLRNIEMTGFKKACQKIRDELYVEDAETFSDLREMYRDNINRAFFKVERPTIRTAATRDEFIQSYRTSALVAGSYIGATKAQAEYLAALEWDNGERRLFEGRLLKGECSIMIDYARRDAAKRA